MSFQCPSRHRAVSSSEISCVWSSNKTHWSGGTPECKPLSRFEDDGFRLALLVSFISSAIILVMSIIFITFCLVRHVKREERARKTGASEFWQQIDVEDVEMQREVLHNQKTTNHNNNNNNNSSSSRGERRHTDKHIYSHGDLHTACRGLHQGKPCPPSIHPSQFSLILSPPTDYLINTHMGPVDVRGAFPVPRDAAEDRHFCRPLHDPLWNGPHPYSPHPPPVQMMSI
ncbi:sushi domain-containing protein 3-like [Sinocyclocheilus grahami]|uniref:sushi domain-containing protein 3-like n=1 Tax=Sinocyclocheilus grahami TaxID=75366 RepID=UPI0007AC7CFB|nr:PREDICTED: sushi domain-containing protein 3-like [Sinocyclocheilus grahami]